MNSKKSFQAVKERCNTIGDLSRLRKEMLNISEDKLLIFTIGGELKSGMSEMVHKIPYAEELVGGFK